MEEVKTKYGVIADCLNLEVYSSEETSSFMFTRRVEIETSIGTVVPQYQVEDHGRQQHKPVFFYKNGNIRKVPLQNKVDVDTNYGTLPAELLMFYEDGSLKKLFSLNGKLSGYWSEKNEYALSEDLKISLPSGDISAKIINIGFYPSGNVRSLTLWPEEIIEAKCPIGTFNTRKGIAFYEDGSVRSLEPAAPASIETPIGILKAFDSDPEGICGDVNSLQFNRTGNFSALCTISDRIIVTTNSQNKKIYEPLEKAGMCSDLVKISIPLLVEFIDGKVRFNNSKRDEYEIAKCSFEIKDYTGKAAIPSYECT